MAELSVDVYTYGTPQDYQIGLCTFLPSITDDPDDLTVITTHIMSTEEMIILAANMMHTVIQKEDGPCDHCSKEDVDTQECHDLQVIIWKLRDV